MDRRTREPQGEPNALDLKIDTTPGVTLRPRRPRRPSNLAGSVNWNLVGVGGALLLLAGLHFFERIRVPGLEHLTCARMYATPEPPRVVRSTPVGPTTLASAPKLPADPISRHSGKPGRPAGNAPIRPVTDPTPAPGLAVADPSEFLRERGIVKKEGLFVLESESKIDACLDGLGEQAKRFNAAFAELDEADANMFRLRGVSEEIINLDQKIAECDGEMNKYTVVWRWGALWAGITAEDNARYHQLKFHRDQLAAQRNQRLNPIRQRLQLTEPGRAYDRAAHEFRMRADETGRHLQGGRQVVERIASECERLAGDPEVRAALRKLGQARLEPSPGYREKSKHFWDAQDRYEKSLAMAGVK